MRSLSEKLRARAEVDSHLWHLIQEIEQQIHERNNRCCDCTAHRIGKAMETYLDGGARASEFAIDVARNFRTNLCAECRKEAAVATTQP